MSKKVKLKHRRRWLKPGDGYTLSYISWTLNKYDTNVTIADCTYPTTIYVSNEKDIKKIDVLIEELTKFRNELEERKDEVLQ